MKHLIPSESDALLDLSKPSLESLAWLLRHREMWPKGFEWDYMHCPTCAMGMAYALWCDQNILSPCPSEMQRVFGMSEISSRQIFMDADCKRGIRLGNVTPEMVADDIDAYLAKRP